MYKGAMWFHSDDKYNLLDYDKLCHIYVLTEKYVFSASLRRRMSSWDYWFVYTYTEIYVCTHTVIHRGNSHTVKLKKILNDDKSDGILFALIK